jgi:hypothetical protein
MDPRSDAHHLPDESLRDSARLRGNPGGLSSEKIEPVDFIQLLAPIASTQKDHQRPPFRAKNEVDLIFAVRDAAPTPCRDLNPHIPPALGDIIDRSMSRSRSGRHQTALEFRDDLLRFLRELNPTYRRTRLARFMKKLWADEIDQDLRALEEYVLDLSPGEADYGKNLIADALGPDAAYNQWSPNPTRVTSVNGDAPRLVESGLLRPGDDDPTIRTVLPPRGKPRKD